MPHSVLGNIKMVGPMLNMSETPLSVNSPAPELGEHTYEVLRKLGFDDQLISDVS